MLLIICHTVLLLADYCTRGEGDKKYTIGSALSLPAHARISVDKIFVTLVAEAPVALMSVLLQMLVCKSALNSAALFDGLQRMSQQPGELGEKRDDGRAAA